MLFYFRSSNIINSRFEIFGLIDFVYIYSGACYRRINHSLIKINIFIAHGLERYSEGEYSQQRRMNPTDDMQGGDISFEARKVDEYI